MPFGPALPNGVRTPSTKTTSRNERDMGPPQEWEPARRGTAPAKLPAGNPAAKPGVPPAGRPTRSRLGRDSRRREELDRELDLPLAGAAGPQHLGDGGGVPRLG